MGNNQVNYRHKVKTISTSETGNGIFQHQIAVTIVTALIISEEGVVPMKQENPRLAELERFDRWLLSRTPPELRQITLLVALTTNLVNAWLLSHFPLVMDGATNATMMVRW